MRFWFLISILAIPFAALHAQHDSTHMHRHDSMPAMSSAYSPSLPMNRNGSGTSWQPDNTPVYAWMQHAGKWHFMEQGSVFIRYTAQNFNNPNKRGASGFSAPNWAMFMAQRQIQNNGLLSVNVMLSADRLTEGGNGYPLLFQSGETWNSQPLADRQHPHDVLMGLSLGYTQRITGNVDVYGSVGYPSEPAVGPTAFMHRISAFNNPDAPLGHHWQDATHITYGVGTVGFRYKIAKVEGSVYTGKEPDEDRVTPDNPLFDSYSYRVSVNPTKSLALQFSQGFIKSPEVLHPEENIIRTTASVQNVAILSPRAYIASSVIYGLNTEIQPDEKNINLHSVLIESDFNVRRFAIYGRFETIKKLFSQLALPGGSNNLSFTLNSITLGTSFRMFSLGTMDVKVGGHFTASIYPQGLNIFYGRTALSGQVYIRMSPQLMRLQTKSEKLKTKSRAAMLKTKK
jgi:hypothetical protein